MVGHDFKMYNGVKGHISTHFKTPYFLESYVSQPISLQWSQKQKIQNVSIDAHFKTLQKYHNQISQMNNSGC
jgi:hypothetical protein